MTTPAFKNFLQNDIGDKPYFDIFGQIFVEMDEDTRTNQDKTGLPVPGRPGTQIF